MKRSPRLSGAVWALLGSALLSWEWIRERGPGPWLPGHGHILGIICAPVLILVGLALVIQGPRATAGNGLDSRRYFLIGIALGFVNAYSLGVWDSVSAGGFRELWSSWWWMFIASAGTVVLAILRRWRKQERTGTNAS